MNVSSPDLYDPNTPVSAETVDGLTMPQLMQRLAQINSQADKTMITTRFVAQVPTVRGVLMALEQGKEQTNELSVILRSIQRRTETLGANIANLKK